MKKFVEWRNFQYFLSAFQLIMLTITIIQLYSRRLGVISIILFEIHEYNTHCQIEYLIKHSMTDYFKYISKKRIHVKFNTCKIIKSIKI